MPGAAVCTVAPGACLAAARERDRPPEPARLQGGGDRSAVVVRPRIVGELLGQDVAGELQAGELQLASDRGFGRTGADGELCS